MVVGYARFDLRIPGSTSLKDKRSVMRALTAMLHNKFRCSIAEVEHQDLRQRGAIGVSVVADTSFHARKVLSEIERHVDTHPGVETISTDVGVFDPEDL